jgi:hypothetical protein
MKKKTLSIMSFMVVLAVTGLASRCPADLHAMADLELARISGTGGISIGIQDLSIYMHTGSFSYTDTDTGNALVLENLTLTNGSFRPAYFATGNVDLDGDGIYSPLTFDIDTISDPGSAAFGRTVMVLRAGDWLQQVHLHAERVRFCDEELGSLDIGVIHRPSFYWLMGAHEVGIDFEHGTRLSIDAIRLTYNQRLESFALNGIHLGAHDPGIPEDPGTWRMAGMFKIGDIRAGRPATLDVGRNPDGMAAVIINLPMSGSLRVENLQWAGADFGPIAIDGIQVHRLNVSFTP